MSDLCKEFGVNKVKDYVLSVFDRYELASTKQSKHSISKMNLDQICNFLEAYPEIIAGMVESFFEEPEQPAPKRKPEPEVPTEPPPKKEKPEPKGKEKEPAVVVVGGCTNLNKLEHQDNSCYMDSVLMVLGNTMRPFLQSHVLTQRTAPYKNTFCVQNDAEADAKVRDKIKELFADVFVRLDKKESFKVTAFRKYLQSCRPTANSQLWWTCETQDAGEFLSYLFSLFDLEEVGQRARRTMGWDATDKKWVPTSEGFVRDKVSPIVTINPLSVQKESRLSDYLKTYSAARLDPGKELAGKYSAMGEQMTYLSSPALIFDFIRTKPTTKGHNVVTLVSMVPDERITLFGQQEKPLYLVAVTVYADTHYTAVFRCEGKWYHYDDQPRFPIVKVADDYQQLLQWDNRRVQKTGTLFFYA